MTRFFKTNFALLALILIPAFLYAQLETQQRFALVIGNGAYKDLSPLTNPVNDAEDIAAVLQSLDFQVEKIINGGQEDMDSAITLLKNRLSASPDAYGFFFYAGHGVQSGGENYLIPVNAVIPGENYLKSRAVSVQLLLDELNDARNRLNVVVLDACRDNPFGWSRSGSRGLSIVTRQPADSIIVYATSAGQRASDGEGRNGLFTSQLLPNLATPGLEVTEVFRRTGADVAELSSRQQVPAIYNQFFGTAFFAGAPSEAGVSQAYIPGQARPAPLPGGGQGGGGQTGGAQSAKQRTPDQAAKLWTVGASVGSSLVAPWFIATAHGTIAPVSNVFIELGFDLGLASGEPDVSFYSLHPFAHIAYFKPVMDKVGVYGGAGGGYMMATYSFTEEGEIKKNAFVADAILGVSLFDLINISYTFRTNFSNMLNKVSVGYTYRFN